MNGPKTWSLAAALHPEIADALDAAQTRAAEQIIGWVAEHATTRVGPKGRQVQVPVSEIEAAVVRHYTSRAGDPHRHLHLQINARVLAEQTWRGLHTVGMRDSLAAINGIGHAAVATDPEFRAVLAAHGFTLDPATGELAELAPYVGPVQRPGRADRPQPRPLRGRVAPSEPRRRARARAAAGLGPSGLGRGPAGQGRPHRRRRPGRDGGTRSCTPSATATRSRSGYRIVAGTPRVGGIDRDQVVEVVLSRLGARRSAWNAADIRGEVEQWIAGTGLVADAAVRTELAEDLTARALSRLRAAAPPRRRARAHPRPDLPGGAGRRGRPRHPAHRPRRAARHVAAFADPMAAQPDAGDAASLDVAQRAAVASLAGSARCWWSRARPARARRRPSPRPSAARPSAATGWWW